MAEDFTVKSVIDDQLEIAEEEDVSFLYDRLDRFNEKLSLRKDNKLIFILFRLINSTTYEPFFVGESEFSLQTTYEHIKYCALNSVFPTNDLWLRACVYIKCFDMVQTFHISCNTILYGVTECESIIYKNNLIQKLSEDYILINELTIGRTYFLTYDSQILGQKKYKYTGSTELLLEERYKDHVESSHSSAGRKSEAGNLYPLMQHVRLTDPLLMNNFRMTLITIHFIESRRELRCFEQENIDKCKDMKDYIPLNLMNSICLRTDEEKKALQAERSKRWAEKNRDRDNAWHRNWTKENPERSREIKHNSREKLKDIYVHNCLYCPSKTGKPMRRDYKIGHEQTKMHKENFDKWHNTYHPEYRNGRQEEKDQFVLFYNSLKYADYEKYEIELRSRLNKN